MKVGYWQEKGYNMHPVNSVWNFTFNKTILLKWEDSTVLID